MKRFHFILNRQIYVILKIEIHKQGFRSAYLLETMLEMNFVDDSRTDSQTSEKITGKVSRVAKASKQTIPPPRTAGRPRQDDVEERTQHLMQVAVDLFLERGYAKVSLEAIAKAARVAVRTIYVKFGGKIGLLRAIVQAERGRFLGSAEELESDTRPMPEALIDYARRFIDAALCARSVVFYRTVIAESKQSPELADIFFQAGPALTRETLKRYFSRPDIQAQLRTDIPIGVLVSHFLNCLSGDHLLRMVMTPVVDYTDDERDERAVMGVSLFLSGTQARPDSAPAPKSSKT